MTKEIICPVKDKTVRITSTAINSTTLDDNNNTYISGRCECSDNDFNCDYSKCPIEKKA